ncbi:MAG: hypothetical protein J3R72DRAFT_506010 [Linnemannia gamsii]|nr:MAG: hypothetical protein J3R72DRAFT_506010 [Linnemannia gamsii]
MSRPPSIDPLTLPDIVNNIIPYLKTHPEDNRSLAYAARVNKAWNALYTPALWENVFFEPYTGTRRSDYYGPDFRRQGIHVRYLHIESMGEDHLQLIGPQSWPYPPLLTSLILSLGVMCVSSLDIVESDAQMEIVVRFLATVKSTLTRFEFSLWGAVPQAGVSALGMIDDTTTGAGDGFAALKELQLNLDIVDGSTEVSWNSLLRLLRVCPHLEKLELTTIDLSGPAVMTDNNEHEGDQMKGIDHGLQGVHLLAEQQTKITTLSLVGFAMDDVTLAHLLGKTPPLTKLAVRFEEGIKDDFLDALPTLCLNVTKLLFSGLTYRCALPLEQLTLDDCTVDDQTLHHIASSQGRNLLELTLRHCKHVTDSGVMAILKGCYRLTAFVVANNPLVTMAILLDDSDYNNNQDNNNYYAKLSISDMERRQNKWSCYKTLKRLNTNSIGLDYGLEIAQNQAAFRGIRRRIRMLPALEHLGMTVTKADNELVKGFLRVEDQKLQETERSRGGGCETQAENAGEIDTATATNNAGATKGAALMGPRLRVLDAWGLHAGGFTEEDIERFLRNFPGLKDFHTNSWIVSKEMTDKFAKAGVELQSWGRRT